MAKLGSIKFLIYLTFLILLVGVSMWSQISLFVSGIGQKQAPFVEAQDSELTQIIKTKTGVDLPKFYVSDSPKVFGMMSGIPGHPTMLLSKPLYKTFSPDELQFVILHEVGHYVKIHTLKETLLGIILAGFGILLLKKQTRIKNALVAAILFGSVFGVILLQYGKLNEYEADHFAISKMDDPRGAIDAAYEFKNAYNQPETETIINVLLYRRIPYNQRIQNAEIEITRRLLYKLSY